MKLNSDIYFILNKLNSNGYEAFVVGGAVRNYLLNIEVKDYDITTNALPSAVINLFEKTIPTGINYGTITVIVNSKCYEITTYRKDHEYLDSRRPSAVHFSNELEEDLVRRDFTINALCMDKLGNIIDPLNGLVDLTNKTIRAIGNPDLRFKEDALRMMRAIRFMAELEFEIDALTLESIKQNSDKIRYISPERVQNELTKILMSKVPSTGIYKMAQTKLLNQIIPELIPCIGFDQHSSYHDKDVFEHTMVVMDNTKPKIELRLAALFHDITKPNCLTIDENNEGHFYGHHIESAELSKEILKRLKFSNEIIQKVWILIRYHPLKEIHIGDKGVKKFINKVGKGNLEDIFNLNYADIIGKSTNKGLKKLINMEEKTIGIIHREDPLSIKDLKINGKDLKEIGINEGPTIGYILAELLAIVLDEPDENTQDKLLEHAKELKKRQGDVHFVSFLGEREK